VPGAVHLAIRPWRRRAGIGSEAPPERFLLDSSRAASRDPVPLGERGTVVHLYDLLLLLGIAQTAVALGAVAIAAPDARPWTGATQGLAGICCALLVRLYFEPSFRPMLGGWAWAIFLYALGWSAVVWFQRVWAFETDDEGAQPSVLGALGVAVEDGVVLMAGLAWHVFLVVPSLVCGGLALFGLARDVPPR